MWIRLILLLDFKQSCCFELDWFISDDLAGGSIQVIFSVPRVLTTRTDQAQTCRSVMKSDLWATLYCYRALLLGKPRSLRTLEACKAVTLESSRNVN